MRKEELVEKTDLTITELVLEKTELLKAYNYYNCKRDPEQYKFLEDNYGIGLPTSVKFIPLIRKHVDALVGEFLNTPIIPKVSCKDTETINNIFREKLLKINEEVFRLLSKNLKNNLLRLIGNKDMTDLNIQDLLEKLVEDVNENFISLYEIAGQNVIQYIIQSRNVDLINKLRLLLVDLLVTGYAFYRVIKSKNNVQIEVLNPLNTFIDQNYESCYIKNSYRSVVRSFLTKSEILAKYGKDLSSEDLETIKSEWNEHDYYSNEVFIRNTTGQGVPASDGIKAGEEVVPLYSGRKHFRLSVIPVYEVEWIETDNDFILQRYSTVRIGNSIYIVSDKDEDVVRTKDAPEKCTLRVNGIYYNNRGFEPYSLVMACMEILD